VIDALRLLQQKIDREAVQAEIDKRTGIPLRDRMLAMDAKRTGATR
jgi:hypothetical protein